MLAQLLGDETWQMSTGERAALAGILADLTPALAIEIGTGQGGSLRRIAAYAGHTHAFDSQPPDPELAALGNVSFHTGDSHVLLERVLAELERRGEAVDFVLVDGDHSAEGVRRDVEDLLRSAAVSQTLIVLHDTANSEVRAGLNAIRYEAWSKVRWVDLDWVPGFVFRDGPLRDQAWAGLGIILVDAERGPAADYVVARHAVPIAELLERRRTRFFRRRARRRPG